MTKNYSAKYFVEDPPRCQNMIRFSYLNCVSLSLSGFLFFYRIRCANILADRLTDGEWVIAKAVFNGTVTGTVRLVRIITDKVFGAHLMFLIYFLSFVWSINFNNFYFSVTKWFLTKQ